MAYLIRKGYKGFSSLWIRVVDSLEFKSSHSHEEKEGLLWW